MSVPCRQTAVRWYITDRNIVVIRRTQIMVYINFPMIPSFVQKLFKSKELVCLSHKGDIEVI